MELKRAWPRIHLSLNKKKRKSLFLDFDGTLAPIAQTPGQARMNERTRRVLLALSQRPDYHLAIISGRSLKTLRRFFPSRKNMQFSGNHGLELDAKGLMLPERARKAKKNRFLLNIMLRKLEESLHSIPGVLVEDKIYTASIHYRNVPEPYLPFFGEYIRFYKEHFKNYPMIWRHGKKVWEIRPNVLWDKGDATLFLWKRHGDTLPIVIGDDTTDEDMFRAIKKVGVAIRVGFSKQSEADYYFHSQPEVTDFLERLNHDKSQ